MRYHPYQTSSLFNSFLEESYFNQKKRKLNKLLYKSKGKKKEKNLCVVIKRKKKTTKTNLKEKRKTLHSILNTNKILRKKKLIFLSP